MIQGWPYSVIATRLDAAEGLGGSASTAALIC